RKSPHGQEIRCSDLIRPILILPQGLEMGSGVAADSGIPRIEREVFLSELFGVLAANGGEGVVDAHGSPRSAARSGRRGSGQGLLLTARHRNRPGLENVGMEGAAAAPRHRRAHGRDVLVEAAERSGARCLGYFVSVPVIEVVRGSR